MGTFKKVDMEQDSIRKGLMKLDKNYLPYEYFEGIKYFEEVEVSKGLTINRLPTYIGISAGNTFSFEPFEKYNMKVLKSTELYVQFIKEENSKSFK